MFCYHFTTSLLLSLSVKEFWKSVSGKVGGKKYSGTSFPDALYKRLRQKCRKPFIDSKLVRRKLYENNTNEMHDLSFMLIRQLTWNRQCIPQTLLMYQLPTNQICNLIFLLPCQKWYLLTRKSCWVNQTVLASFDKQSTLDQVRVVQPSKEQSCPIRLTSWTWTTTRRLQFLWYTIHQCSVWSSCELGRLRQTPVLRRAIRTQYGSPVMHTATTVQVTYSLYECRCSHHLPYFSHWAYRWIHRRLRHMASTMPELQLSSSHRAPPMTLCWYSHHY